SHPSALPILRARLGDVDGETRALAVKGLQRPLLEAAGTAPEEVVRDLLGLLADSVYAVRIEAIRTLATFGAGPAQDAVMQVALTGGPHERAAALEALGRAGEAASPA